MENDIIFQCVGNCYGDSTPSVLILPNMWRTQSFLKDTAGALYYYTQYEGDVAEFFTNVFTSEGLEHWLDITNQGSLEDMVNNGELFDTGVVYKIKASFLNSADFIEKTYTTMITPSCTKKNDVLYFDCDLRDWGKESIQIQIPKL
jgi:hypothetical protein